MWIRKRLRLHRLATYRSTGGDGDGDGDGDPPDPPPPPTPPPKPPDNEKKFTQADVNRLLSQNKQRDRQEKEQYLQELKDLRDRGVTAENLDALNARITSIQNEGKTKAQLAEEEKHRLLKGFEVEKETLHGKAKQAEERYVKYRISTEVIAAASKNEAFNPEQVLDILRPKITMVEELDTDGKATGELVPRVKLEDVDGEGKPVVLDLTVTEAVKRMKQMRQHHNLFDSGASGGVGGFTKGGVTNGVPTETAAYMAARAKNPNLTRNLKQ